MKALEETIEIAKESESPRAFEVAFAAMKTISELNSQLIDIH
jgi:hypothetical protein